MADTIRRDDEIPLHRQIYDKLRDAVLSRRLPAGSRLPSTRSFAKGLDVSRNTVAAAFDQLIAEGYLVGKRGAGTFVEENISDEILKIRNKQEILKNDRGGNISVSDRAKRIILNQYDFPFATNKSKAFGLCFGVEDAISADVWKRLLSNNLKRNKHLLFQYGESVGYLPLRSAISEWLRETRGIDCSASQIIIISGSQQGIDLTSRVLFDRGERVWIEDPNYPGTYDSLSAAGAEVVPVPLDGDGINLKTGADMSQIPKAVYVTPSSHFPLGQIMSLNRRLEILEWAERENVWIVEDDEGSEFRYTGSPFMALKGLDTTDRVIYLGTFTRLLFTSLRLGFLVVPKALSGYFRRAISVTTSHPSIMEQAALSEFIREGYLSRHIRRIRAVCSERKQILVRLINAKLNEFIEIKNVDAGMNLIGTLKNGLKDIEIAEAAFARGINVSPLSGFCVKVKLPDSLLFGFTSLDEKEMKRGVLGLREVFENFSRRI